MLFHFVGQLMNMLQHFASIWTRGCLPRRKGRNLAKNPRVPQHRSTEHHGGHPGFFFHSQSILGVPDVSIANDRDIQFLNEAANDPPVCHPLIEVDPSTWVHRDEITPHLLNESSNINNSRSVIEARTDLGRQG